MKRKVKLILLAIGVAAVAVGAIALYSVLASNVEYIEYETDYISPADISVSGESAYVADATLGKVYKLSLSSGKVEKTYDAQEQANGVLATDDGIFALTGSLDGKVTKLDGNFNVLAQAETGHTPVSSCVIGDKLYVANRFSGSVSVYNTADLTKANEDIAVGREPMALTAVGNKIYVAKHLPETSANSDEGTSATVAVIDTLNGNTVKYIQLTNGSDGVKGIATDGDKVYVAHIIARYTYPTSQLDRGWINTNAISVIDVQTDSLDASVLLDEVELGAPNPWGVKVSGNKLAVTVSGAHKVIILDTNELLNRIDSVKKGNNEKVKTADAIADYLPFLDGMRNSVELSGEGCRNLDINGGKAYICNYFTGNIEIVDLENGAVSGTVELGKQPEADAKRQGEILWYDGTACYQNWESCASCHPDGRCDGLNWDNLNDGLGTPKQVASMVYSHRTPPVMITGARDSAELAVRKGMQYIQFNTMSEEQMACIDEYLKSIVPEQSPYLNRDGSLTELAKEGEEIFKSVGCAECHPAPLYTDLKKHTSTLFTEGKDPDGWENREFATPTLVEIWRTAPYYFNGQYVTLRDAVEASLGENHGLSERQIDALTAFVGSIGNINEYYGVEQVRITDGSGNEKINTLMSCGSIKSVTVKKQLDTDKKAKVTLTVFRADGTKVKEISENLKAMDTGDTAKITTDIKLPDDLAEGDYVIISITDASDSTVKLATDIKIS